MTAIERAGAEDDLERLRFGLPPRQHARHFTAGQDAVVAALQRTLAGASSRLQLTAPAGAGKSHMLAVARELALRTGYAVAKLDLAEEPDVQLDRPDTLFGAVCRRLAIADAPHRGVTALFTRLASPPNGDDGAPEGEETSPNAASGRSDAALAAGLLARCAGDLAEAPLRDASARALAVSASVRRYAALASAGRWDYSEYLRTPALYIAVRAWLRSADLESRLLVDDWLRRPAAYREQQGRLYEALVYRQRDRFRDPRPERQFRSGGVLALHAACRTQLSTVLADLGRLARAAGLPGFVLVLDGLDEHCQALGDSRLAGALSTLLQLVAPEGNGRDDCPLRVFGAATPELAALLEDYRQAIRKGSGALPLAAPPTLALGEPPEADWLALAHRLRCAHALAYNWDAEAALPDADLALLVHRLCSSSEQRRGVAQGVVVALDARIPPLSPES